MDGPTDTGSYRDATAHLKTLALTVHARAKLRWCAKMGIEVYALTKAFSETDWQGPHFGDGIKDENAGKIEEQVAKSDSQGSVSLRPRRRQRRQDRRHLM